MGGHLPAGRGRVVFRPDRLQEHLVGGHADLKTEGAVPVVAVEPVVRRLQQHRRGCRDRLVPGTVDLEVDLVLPLELDFLVVDPPGEVDVAVGGDQFRSVETPVFV